MSALLIIPAFFVGIYYWYAKYVRIDALRKKKQSIAKPKIHKPKKETPEYRCVFIETGPNACHAAEQLAAVNPILMHQAETLPLNACNAETCTCGYIRSDDRRASSRRRDLSGAEFFATYSTNKRKKTDRRKKVTLKSTSKFREKPRNDLISS